MDAVQDYRLHRCSICDLEWADPMHSPGAVWYAEHDQYRKTLWFGLDTLSWNHRQFLEDRPGKGGRLLDVGCGSGRFLQAAAGLGYLVSGLDFNPEAISAARQRFALADLYCGTVEDFLQDRGRESFDVVTAFEVLEHVEAPRQFLASLHALIRGGGSLVLSVPYRDRWPRLRSSEIWDRPPHHLTRWSKGAITSALSRAGFEVVDLRTGWDVGEEIVLHTVRFGLIQGLFHRASRQHLPVADRRRLADVASRLMRVKRVGARLLGVPVNVVLKALGATGLDMYALAKKP